MGLAKVCKCGHNKRDHSTLHLKGQPNIHTECEWFDCECKMFDYEKTISSNYEIEPKETLIDCTLSMKTKGFAPSKTMRYKLDDCDYRGTAQNRAGIHPKRYTNGEYP